MEMSQIRYFLAVCDNRNFTQAAQRVFVSQPSLTQAIKKLEDEMGGALFLRDRSGCRLTALGKLVEPDLRQLYNQALDTKTKALRFSRINKVPVRIGLMDTIGSRGLNPFFASYQKEYPTTELELILDKEMPLLRQLQDGALDLLISAPAVLPGRPCVCEPLYEERYLLAFASKHRFNGRETVDLQSIELAYGRCKRLSGSPVSNLRHDRAALQPAHE